MAMANIPEDIVIEEILHRLPIKYLFSLMTVSNKWYHIITSDSKFAVKQYSHNINNPKGFIFVMNRKPTNLLKCLSLADHSHSHIGIADPTLQFLSSPSPLNRFDIMASTGGLVCIANFDYLYVCNPVTRQNHRLPCCQYYGYGYDSVGLAFDPISYPRQFKLVHQFMSSSEPVCEFEVFSSNNASQGWVKSNEKVLLPKRLPPKKSVFAFAKGILYWDFSNDLLWFYCTSTSIAGYVSKPPSSPPQVTNYDYDEVGVRDGRHVTCSRLFNKCLEVWELVHDVMTSTNVQGMWEKRYCIELFKMHREIEYDAGFKIRFTDLWMRPLPYEGGRKVYLRVKYEFEERRKKKKILRERMKMVSFDFESETAFLEKRFDGNELLLHSNDINILFGYENNLFPLPDLSN